MPAVENIEIERDLLDRSRNGEREAFGMIVRAHQGRIFRFVLRMVREPATAEDITQEVFIRAYRKLHLYDPGQPFLPWLFRITANLTRNHLKSVARRGRVVVGEAFERFATPPEEPSIRQEELNRLELALGQLSEKERAPLLLKHIEGFSYREISRALGVTVFASKMRVSRARRRLRHLLSHESNPNLNGRK